MRMDESPLWTRLEVLVGSDELLSLRRCGARIAINIHRDQPYNVVTLSRLHNYINCYLDGLIDAGAPIGNIRTVKKAVFSAYLRAIGGKP